MEEQLKNAKERSFKERKETWFILLVLTPCNFLLGVLWIAFPILYIEFADYFCTTQGEAGWIGSIQNGLQQFLGFFIGPLVDTYECKRIAVIGSIISSFGIGISSLAPNVFFLYFTYGIVSGTGLAMLNLSSQVIVQQHFSKNRSKATSIAMNGKSLGKVLGPFVIEYLVDTFGWRGAMIVFSAIFLNTLALALGFRSTRYVNNGQETSVARDIRNLITDCSICGDVPFLLFCASAVMFKFNNLTFFRQLPSRLVHGGTDRQKAVIILSITSAFSMTGRLVSGILGDIQCLNRVVYYAFCLLVTGVTTSLFVVHMSLLQTGVVCAAVGVATGSATLMTNLVLVDLSGTEKIAKNFGSFGLCSAMAGFLATPATGWLFDMTGSYDIPFLLAGFLSAAGGIISFCLYCAKKQQQK